MRHRRMLSISNLVLDRTPINPRILALVEFLHSGGVVPAIHVQYNKDNGQWNVLDGRHRVVAYKLLGRAMIEVRYGTLPVIVAIAHERYWVNKQVLYSNEEVNQWLRDLQRPNGRLRRAIELHVEE